MKFEYDSVKSGTHLKKHGISLEQAKELWQVQSVEVQARTVDEPRCMIIGKLKGKFYSCIFTTRGEVTRIISARRSRASEEVLYNETVE